jgi:hypothetical protein
MSWRDKYGDEGYRKGDMLGFTFLCLMERGMSLK